MHTMSCLRAARRTIEEALLRLVVVSATGIQHGAAKPGFTCWHFALQLNPKLTLLKMPTNNVAAPGKKVKMINGFDMELSA